MRRFLIGGSRPAASALVLMLAVTFCANCVPFAQTTSEQRADCPMDEKHACCVSEAEKVQQGSVVKPFFLEPPSMVAAAILFDFDAELRDGDSDWRSAADASPLRPPGVPTYLLVSSFRI